LIGRIFGPNQSAMYLPAPYRLIVHSITPVLQRWVALWLLFGLYTTHGFAQSLRADSLKQLIAQTPSGEKRIELLCEYAWEINEDDPALAAKMLREALVLAQKQGFAKGEANAWNGLGVVAEVQDSFRAALRYYYRALPLRDHLGDALGVASLYNNIGIAYENLAQYDSALIALRRNLQVVEQLADTARIARAHFNIAGVYEQEGDYLEADKHLNNARQVLESGSDLSARAKAYSLLGHIRLELEEYSEARRWYAAALALRQQQGDPIRLADAYSDFGNALDELGNANAWPDTIQAGIEQYMKAIALCRQMGDEVRLGAVYNNLADAYKHLGQQDRAFSFLKQSFEVRQRIDDAQGLMEVYNGFGDVWYRKNDYKKALEYVKLYYPIAISTGNQKFEQKAYKDFAKIYAKLGDFKQAFEYQLRYDDIRYKNISEARARSFARREVLYADEQMRSSLKEQRYQLDLQQAQLRSADTQRKALIGGAIGLLLLLGLLFNRNLIRARANRELASKNAIIEQERHRADELLFNILPAATAAELKQYNMVRPVRHDSATVLFTDFHRFTRIAEVVAPEDLIGELDECFRLFDAIVERYGLEKIKTIGDSYMCAGGIPLANDTHPVDAVQAAIDMHRELEALMARKKAEGKPEFQMRIGIHTGPVVAGVVGSHKFAYDIWGDTVNTAARLEQGSEVGRINISGSTYERIKHLYTCTFRGELPAKNKGVIAMYFVEF
jgi:adenylate cyclase